MKAYDTMTEAINGLRQRGYTADFNIRFDCIYCGADSSTLLPSEFEIDEVYRFEGPTDPADSAILYAISSHHGMKGLLVNAYGAYADPMTAQMIARLSTHS
jgi:hypothetical protein